MKHIKNLLLTILLWIFDGFDTAFQDEGLVRIEKARRSGDGNKTDPPPFLSIGDGNKTDPPPSSSLSIGDGNKTDPPPRKRRLAQIRISFISLVKSPANMKAIIAKSGESVLDTSIKILKADEARQIVYGIVYSPNEIDSQGDYADQNEIEKASYDFMKNGRNANVDENHDEKMKDAYVAESWITKTNDPVFPDEPVGSWAVGIKVDDPKLWEKVDKGEITGLSMMGVAKATVEEVSKSDVETILSINELVTGDTVIKGFKEKLLATETWRITDALNQSIRDVLKDDKKTGKVKVAEIKTVLEEFLTWLAGQIESAPVTKSNEVASVLETAFAPVLESLNKMNERIQSLESVSNGRQSIEGDEGVQKNRVKGLRIF